MSRYREPVNGVGVRDLPSRLKAALEAAAKEMPPGTGITLFAFTFGERGGLSYISNAQRDGMIATVEEWLAHQKRIGGK